MHHDLRVRGRDPVQENFAEFRRHIVAQTRTRLMRFIHIATTGLTRFRSPNFYNIDFAQVDAVPGDSARMQTLRWVQGAHCPRTSSPKQRHRAAEAGIMGRAKSRNQWQLMVHTAAVETRKMMSDILDLAAPGRRGDLMRFSGAPNMRGRFSPLSLQDGKLLPAALSQDAAPVQSSK